MSDRIDVEIKDSVDGQIIIKIGGIATAAKEAYTAIEILKKQLQSIGASGLSQLKSQLNSLNTSIRAQQALKDKAAKDELALIQYTANQENKLRNSQVNTINRAMNAQTAAIERASKEELALLQYTANQENRFRNKQIADANKTSIAKIEAVERAAREELALIQFTANQENRLRTQQTRQRERLAWEELGIIQQTAKAEDRLWTQNRLSQLRATGQAASYNNAIALSRHHMVNLGYQIQDIVVGLKSGQAPLTVLVQQGSQIAGIAASAGVGFGTMAKAIWNLTARFIPYIAAVGAAVGALAIFRAEINKKADLESYAKTLGLTHKEMKKLEDVTVTWGDTFKGLWKTLSDNIHVDKTFDSIKNGALSAFKAVTGALVLSIQSWYGLLKAFKATSDQLWAKAPESVSKVAKLTNVPAWFAKAYDRITGSNKSAEWFPDVKDNGKQLTETFLDSYMKGLEDAKKWTEKFSADWTKNTVDVAKKRLQDQAKEIIADRTPKKEKEFRDRRSEEMDQIYRSLTEEVSLLKEREAIYTVENRLLKIKNDLQDKGIELHEKEAAYIRQQLQDIQDLKSLNAYDDLVSSINDETEALKKVGEERFIQKRMNEVEIDFAKRHIELTDERKKSLESLYGVMHKIAIENKAVLMNKELEEQMNLLSVIGPEREIMAQMQKLENELGKDGLNILKQINPELENNLKLLQHRQQIDNELQKIYNETVGSQKQLQNEYEALNLALSKGIITSDQYSKRLIKLNIAANDLKLALGYGDLSSAALGSLNKVVDGYKNVLSGLSDSFGDFFKSWEDGFANSIGRAVAYGDDLGESLKKVAKDAIAELISSLIKLSIQLSINAALGKSLSGAFLPNSNNGVSQFFPMKSALSLQSGGYTGNLRQSEIAGVVHGREFVVNSEATAANRPMLEAINSGRSAAYQVSVNIENYGTSKVFDVQMDEGSVRIIARDEAKSMVHQYAPNVIASDLANPNSRTSKAVVQNTTTRRRR